MHQCLDTDLSEVSGGFAQICWERLNKKQYKKVHLFYLDFDTKNKKEWQTENKAQ